MGGRYWVGRGSEGRGSDTIGVGGLTVMEGGWERGAVFDKERIGGKSGVIEREGDNSGLCREKEGTRREYHWVTKERRGSRLGRGE